MILNHTILYNTSIERLLSEISGEHASADGHEESHLLGTCRVVFRGLPCSQFREHAGVTCSVESTNLETIAGPDPCLKRYTAILDPIDYIII